MLLLFLFLPFFCLASPKTTEDIFKGLFPIQPPHCSRTPIVIAQTSQDANDAIKRSMQMQFHIGLHTTVCFRLEEDADTVHNQLNPKDTKGASSWLHTIRLEKLEHHHPVTQAYVFAIPEVRTECFCECDATASSCTAESHQFTQCPEGDMTTEDRSTSCYRTFFPNQSPIGCDAGSSPKLCCDVKFRPYRNQSFTAVKLEQPSTFATFVYTAYDFSHGRWHEMDKTTIRTQLDGGTQDKFLDSLRRIALSVAAGGRASHQLESGMYFANHNPGGEMDGLRKQPLNEIMENNFDRLGWYRLEDSKLFGNFRREPRFHVFNGPVRMDEIHKAKVKNCKDQTYRSVLVANNYMPDNFNLSRPLEMIYPWIQSARLYDGTTRQAIVTHAEGTNLYITLQVTDEGNGHRLVFFHNASRVDDFTGSIIVDSRSNRYFNLTVYGASGKINGIVKYSTNKESDEIYSFTTYVHDLSASNRSMIIPLPAVVEGGPRMICLRSDEQREESSICRIVEYHESPLEIDIDESTWHEMVGRCPSCNQINLGGITKYLNPMSWVNGVSSLGEFVMMATDVFIYVAILFVFYVVLTKIIIPIMKCWICPLYIISKKEKKNKTKKKKPSIEDGSMV
ncbi:unnamed protein product [Auanema sp. JU1783]|nr:unnamed protein product [Auanema sp. JU1783]